MQIGSWNSVDKVLVVAEIGNNHEGNIEVAKRLVHQAAESGADAVKFQTFQTRYFVSAKDKARYERLLSFELSYRQFESLHALAKSLGLLFISTPLDLDSAAFLADLVDCYKIASGDNNFYPLIARICATGKPLIMSSGLSDFAQVLKSKQFIEAQWAQHGLFQDLAILHCVSSYPVPPEQANVAAVKFLAEHLDCTVGYSDHTLGIEACLIAVALGAQIIEKHFTLDKQYSSFRDHQLSADPADLALLVQKIAQVRLLLGLPGKHVQQSEAVAAQSIRRAIVAATDLTAGHRLCWEDLTWLRPAVGEPPGSEDRLIGRTLKRAVPFGEPILVSDLA
jgi:N,N'-diacetyllegionaminate synthase